MGGCLSTPAPPVLGLNTSVAYTTKGDLRLALINNIHQASPIGCSSYIKPNSLQFPEVVKYAIREVNSREDLLPNVTLGLVALDTCSKSTTALAQATRFVPSDLQCDAAITRGNHSKQETPPQTYDVVGLIGPSTSSDSVMIASYLSLFHIPLLAVTATSDELSDKDRFKYFSRLMPPDRYQAELLVDVMLRYNWSYISLIYDEGSYGENGAKQIEKLAKQHNICIAYSQRLSSLPSREEFTQAVENLLKHKKARAVVLFASPDSIGYITKTMAAYEPKDSFYWLAADYAGAFMTLSADLAGMLFPSGFAGTVPDFEEYYRNLSPWNSENPWLRELWTQEFKCSWSVMNNDSSSCHRLKEWEICPPSR